LFSRFQTPPEEEEENEKNKATAERDNPGSAPPCAIKMVTLQILCLPLSHSVSLLLQYVCARVMENEREGDDGKEIVLRFRSLRIVFTRWNIPAP